MKIENRICIIGAGGVSKAAVLLLSKYYPEYDVCVISKSPEPLLDIQNSAKIMYNKHIDVFLANVENTYVIKHVLEIDFKPKLLVNLGLPYYNMELMDLCLDTGVHYLDSACFEDINNRGIFSAKPQWDLSDKFIEKNLTGVVSCGLTPGFTSVAVNYAENELNFKEINVVKIYDANASTNKNYKFATNFSPAVNLDEVNQDAKYWDINKGWVTVPAFSIKENFKYPEISEELNSYLIYHEELESIVHNYEDKGLKLAQNFMTFGDTYLKVLDVINILGLQSTKDVDVKGQQVKPIDMLCALLPDPRTKEFAEGIDGKVEVAVYIEGILSDGTSAQALIYNIKDIKECYNETNTNGVSWNTSAGVVPGIVNIMEGVWTKTGVYSPESFDGAKEYFEIMKNIGLPNKIDVKFNIQ